MSKRDIPTATDRRSGVDRRTAPPARPPRFPPGQFLTEHGANYTKAQVEFADAIDRCKREKRRPYLTWEEVLTVALALGYRKIERAADRSLAHVGFPRAMRNFMHEKRRRFPASSEVLDVLLRMGYRLVAPAPRRQPAGKRNAAVRVAASIMRQ